MVKYYRIESQKLVECAKEEAILIQYIAPLPEELQDITHQYQLDDHDVHSSVDHDELSRLDCEEDYTLLILKSPENYSSNNLFFDVNSIGIFLLKEKMIVIMPEEIQILAGKQFAKFRTREDILIKIIYGIINHFLGHLKVINMVSEELEQKIATSMENKYLINMFTLEKSLVYYLNSINSNASVMDKLRLNASKIGFTPEQVDLMEEIIIENQQCQKQAEIYLNILTGLMDARGSIVNNNLNILIKRLTIINIIFMPLNLLASIGGMSEYSMMTQALGWKFAYPLFFFSLFIIGVLTHFVMNKLLSTQSPDKK